MDHLNNTPVRPVETKPTETNTAPAPAATHTQTHAPAITFDEQALKSQQMATVQSRSPTPGDPNALSAQHFKTDYVTTDAKRKVSGSEVAKQAGYGALSIAAFIGGFLTGGATWLLLPLTAGGMYKIQSKAHEAFVNQHWGQYDQPKLKAFVSAAAQGIKLSDPIKNAIKRFYGHYEMSDVEIRSKLRTLSTDFAAGDTKKQIEVLGLLEAIGKPIDLNKCKEGYGDPNAHKVGQMSPEKFAPGTKMPPHEEIQLKNLMKSHQDNLAAANKNSDYKDKWSKMTPEVLSKDEDFKKISTENQVGINRALNSKRALETQLSELTRSNRETEKMAVSGTDADKIKKAEAALPHNLQLELDVINALGDKANDVRKGEIENLIIRAQQDKITAKVSDDATKSKNAMDKLQESKDGKAARTAERAERAAKLQAQKSYEEKKNTISAAVTEFEKLDINDVLAVDETAEKLEAELNTQMKDGVPTLAQNQQEEARKDIRALLARVQTVTSNRRALIANAKDQANSKEKTMLQEARTKAEAEKNTYLQAADVTTETNIAAKTAEESKASTTARLASIDQANQTRKAPDFGGPFSTETTPEDPFSEAKNTLFPQAPKKLSTNRYSQEEDPFFMGTDSTPTRIEQPPAPTTTNQPPPQNTKIDPLISKGAGLVTALSNAQTAKEARGKQGPKARNLETAISNLQRHNITLSAKVDTMTPEQKKTFKGHLNTELAAQKTRFSNGVITPETQTRIDAINLQLPILSIGS